MDNETASPLRREKVDCDESSVQEAWGKHTSVGVGTCTIRQTYQHKRGLQLVREGVCGGNEGTIHPLPKPIKQAVI